MPYSQRPQPNSSTEAAPRPPRQRRFAVALVLGSVGVASGCSYGGAAAYAPDLAGAATTDMPDGASSPGVLYPLFVQNGAGSGQYAAGETVHVFSTLDPAAALFTAWTGDTMPLASKSEWHTTLVMPQKAVMISATSEPRALRLVSDSYAGVSLRTKRLQYQVPTKPRGLLLLLHGTGGSNRVINGTEMAYVALAALERRYLVVAPDAEEVIAGDLNSDGKIRFDVAATTTNVDLRNLNSLMRELVQAGVAPSGLPVFALGVSSGGAFATLLGAVGAKADLAAALPSLRLKAVASYCAPAPKVVQGLTKTPTAFYLCRNDSNAEVGTAGNQLAAEQEMDLKARSVPTERLFHEPSPVYEQRFDRSANLDAGTSAKLVAELRAGGLLDERGFLTKTPALVSAALTMGGAAKFPVYTALVAKQKTDVLDELAVAYADHAAHSDLVTRTLDFFDAQNPNPR